jgi:hypothetical protein
MTPTTFGIDCRADKYTCTQLDSLARDFLRHHFEKVVQFDGQLPNRVGLTSLSQTALVQILTDDNLELSSEVHSLAMLCCMLSIVLMAHFCEYSSPC